LRSVTRPGSKCSSISTGAKSGGYGGSTADAERVILRTGSTVVIRPLAAGDEAAIASWFAGLSAETRYARFFGFLEQPEGPSLRLRVWTTSTMRRSRRSPPTEPRSESQATYAPAGEVAVAVADDWRGQASLACCSNGSLHGAVRRDRSIHRDLSCYQ
jgi:hypothetical protein